MNTEKEKLNILLVDDHHMVRDGIKVMLDECHLYEFKIDEAETGFDAVKKIKYKDYDLVISDYQLPDMNGNQVVESMLLYKPQLKILALSNYDELGYISSMIGAGARGYILKNIEPFELILAIRTVLQNKTYYSNEIALKLINKPNNTEKINSSYKNKLTNRELEILKMIAQEMTNEQIAQSLFISKRTVDSHRQNLINKLNAKNTVGLVKSAYLLKLI